MTSAASAAPSAATGKDHHKLMGVSAGVRKASV